MKKYEKEILEAQLKSEEAVIKKLKQTYKSALKQVQDKIELLSRRPQTQSVIYQKKYQQDLLKELSMLYKNAAKSNAKTIEQFMKDTYTDSFYQSMYSLHSQGVNIIMPVNKDELEAMANRDAEKLGLSKNLYDNADKVANQAVSVASRGIASGSNWAMIGAELARVSGMQLHQATRIARTEGHRINNQVRLDTAFKARDEYGANTVKQWMSVLDARTRTDHVHLDGQVRELEDPFEVAGLKAMAPGMFGIASEDINCRCFLSERARWALSDKELASLKESGEIYDLSPKSLDKFKDLYNKYLKKNDTVYTINNLKNKLKNKNYKQFPSEIAKVKRGEKMSFKKADGGNVNPLYYSSDKYRTNCQSSVVAYEMRRRGYNVEAKAKDNYIANALAKKSNIAWINEKTGKFSEYIYGKDLHTTAGLLEWMEKETSKKGRYTFEYSWTNSKGRHGGHIIIAENVKNKLRLYDPQTGVVYNNYSEIGEKLKNVDFKRRTPKLIRIDNKAINLDVANEILKGAK
jgi:hypothetical protein